MCAQTRSILRSEAELLAEREASDKMLQEKKVHHLYRSHTHHERMIAGKGTLLFFEAFV